MSKEKSPSPTLTQIDFVSSLELDEAVEVLGALASPDTPLTLTEIDPDTWRFAIGYYESDQKTASVTIAGRLRRWHGTYTRVDGISRLSRSPVSASDQNNRTMIISAAAVLFLLYVIYRMYTNHSIPFYLIMIPVFLLLVALAFVRQSFRLSPRMAAIDNDVYFSDLRLEHQRDRLFEDIIRVFRLAGDVSEDIDELDASDDPGLNAVLDRNPTGEYRAVKRR